MLAHQQAEERVPRVRCGRSTADLSLLDAVRLARSVHSRIPPYLGQAGQTETVRPWPLHGTHQLKRGFEATLRLALQWP